MASLLLTFSYSRSTATFDLSMIILYKMMSATIRIDGSGG